MGYHFGRKTTDDLNHSDDEVKVWTGRAVTKRPDGRVTIKP